MVFKEVGIELPSVWKPKEEGDSIEGTYIRKKENVGKNKANLYIIEKHDGEKISVWGSTVLDDKMDYVSLGNVIIITFLGNDEGKNYHKYKVEVDEQEDSEK